MNDSGTIIVAPQWHLARFDQLSVHALHALIKLRVDVFIVEQCCPYPELDGRDTEQSTLHVLGYLNDEIVAYARILDLSEHTLEKSDNKDEAIHIGRVLVRKDYRNRGLATLLMQQCIQVVRQHRHSGVIRLAAQLSVQPFYLCLGFHPVSAIYSEDGIEHIDMQLTL